MTTKGLNLPGYSNRRPVEHHHARQIRTAAQPVPSTQQCRNNRLSGCSSTRAPCASKSAIVGLARVDHNSVSEARPETQTLVISRSQLQSCMTLTKRGDLAL
ncbi:hypothetical protein V2G26_008772 [Clonostachys chloroleuca]